MKICIASLLGPKARKMGCRCECEKCKKPDFKMRQANDKGVVVQFEFPKLYHYQ